MEPLYNENDEKMRLKRDDRGNKLTAATVLNWWLIPGFIGMLLVILGKIVAGVASFLPRNESLTRSFNRALKNLNEDFSHLIALEWDKTNIGILLLFGFILGVFIKYAYSDKKFS